MSEVVRVAGVVSLAGTATGVGALAYLHLAPTGLSPIRNAVSEYGISTRRAGYRVATIAMGAAGGALAVGLASALGGAGLGVVVALLWVFAACRFAISWFPMDPRGAERTSTGAAHGILAVVTFGSAAAAAIRLCKVIEDGVRWQSLAEPSRWLGWAMVGCFALMLVARMSPELRRWFGAIERGMYAAILVWLVVFGAACATAHP